MQMRDPSDWTPEGPTAGSFKGMEPSCDSTSGVRIARQSRGIAAGATVGVIVGIVLLFRWYRSTPDGHYRIDEWILRLPLVGPMTRTFILARVSRGLSVMLKNSIHLDDALSITAQLAANDVYQKHFREMRAQAIDGLPMFPVMAGHPKQFPEQYWLQFRAAEDKSKLKETLNYLGEMYNDEVTTQVEGLTTAIEPILIVFLGGVVGVIVVSVFLPMTTMMNSIGSGS